MNTTCKYSEIRPIFVASSDIFVLLCSQNNFNLMKRLLYILSVLFLTAVTLHAQKKGFDPEKLYRPVYGYVVDTCTNTPMRDILVYGFDSAEDAETGRKALIESRNPMKIKLKGDVVEVRTDASGRYMLPALSKGALLFWFKDRKTAVIEGIAGRSCVNLGKKEKEWSVSDLDLDKYALSETDPRKGRNLDPVAVDLKMDFKCYIPYLNEEAADSRIWVERRIIDLETGETLACHVPVARDGRNYHRIAKRRHSKKEICDTLLSLTESLEPLSEKTSEVMVKDNLSTDPWKSVSFRLGYFVMQDKAGEIRHIDTLYMLTNRVSCPLKYIEYTYSPYEMSAPVVEELPSVRPVKRRLVLQGVYSGTMPDVLKDTSYLLEEMHLKAEVTTASGYKENIIRADSLVDKTMKEMKAFFGTKVNDGVRMTKTSSSISQAGVSKVEYRLVLRTDRRFSRAEYLRLFSEADDRDELDSLCLRSLEESAILEGRKWDYAANLLASGCITDGHADVDLLAPFIDDELGECDFEYEDHIKGRKFVRNRKEIVANQVMMLMLAGNPSKAAELAEILPVTHASLRGLARCLAGIEPATKAEMEAVAVSSPRNRVVIDMYSGFLDDNTEDALFRMPEDDAMTWFLRARYLCLMYDNDQYEMKNTALADNDITVYDAVALCLRRCFEKDNSFKTLAVRDSGIEENVLKEVLGVLFL